MYRVVKGVDLTFYKVNLWEWVKGTIDKISSKESIAIEDWNNAWKRTYFELGGKSKSSATKGCPRKAAYTLYYLGRIIETDRPYLDWSYLKIKDELSKNGVYAVMAISLLKKKPRLTENALWSKIQEKYRTELNYEPAETNQGGPTVAFKLFHNNKIKDK